MMKESIFDNKMKYILVSEDEVKKLHQYVFDKITGFDYVDAKNLFNKINSRQAQQDVKSWQLVCKYCPLYLRCEVSIENTSKCIVYNKMKVRDYSRHAMDEIQFQRKRLFDILTTGECDENCSICILCENNGACMLTSLFGKSKHCIISEDDLLWMK